MGISNLDRIAIRCRCLTYGCLFAAMRASGQTSRARLADLLIASNAASNGPPLYIQNPSDFAGLEDIVVVKAI
jgi:predicted nucleic acid-binding protein